MITNVGLLGYGTVGAGVAKIISLEDSLLSQKVGWSLKLARATVRDLDAPRAFPPPPGLLTTDPRDVVGNPDIQVVVEAMGGIEPARTLILKALESGQNVVTANKALLAIHGVEIFAKAKECRREIFFEAAVAGAIPVIRTLKEGLAANRILSVFGILNGTTNYILTRMTQDASSFQDALFEAQSHGYAEADPTADVEGFDAAHKLIILTALAHGVLPSLKDIQVEGITKLDAKDFDFAGELGFTIKLLAVSARNPEDGLLEVRLHPAMIPQGHLLAGVSGVLNAVVIRGHASGDIFLSGAGAGMMATASAVVGDIIEIARLSHSAPAVGKPSLGWQSLTSERIKSPTEIYTRYYLRFTVHDRPGVLAAISGVFSAHNISIAQVIQKGVDPTGSVSLVILTHLAAEKDLQMALSETQKLGVLTAETKLIRVEDFARY
ncbi:MAG: homoserine dehydrogenase [Deltaproteobacteria bacterium]|jgi:homoserine dehydrogenase|nr:homoserine dehydrogenase [Deltaproteobacteria bacterium]